jgi:signal transduction histidine kinase
MRNPTTEQRLVAMEADMSTCFETLRAMAARIKADELEKSIAAFIDARTATLKEQAP